MSALLDEPATTGAPRDTVRLMVAERDRPLAHTRFTDLSTHLRAGDLLIANASATIPASANMLSLEKAVSRRRSW